ncbi:hypothetical protein [Gracilimonas sediminicola]|uniref:WG containing repeat-containing protein n=1 Tax=Gracilimonas sediminicola TaxID=2952158 RepID=A0A9X2L4A7_9BACT|nr:hypothetical protein [Gracilimonas sediminicola]MCP9292110.1 hypothetical protein [Gracilimonas sediminicola]
MKTLNYILFTLLVASFTSVAHGQVEDPVDYQTVPITNQAGTQIYTEDSKDVVGSPLIKDSFKNGRILFDSNKASEIMPLNFDAYRNQVLFIKDDQIRVLNTNNVRGFVFEKPADFASSDKVQEVFTLQLRNEEFGFREPTPVQVLYNQKTGLKLLALHRSNLMKGNNKDPFTGKVTDRYISDTEYFLQTRDGKITELRRLRDKDIMNVLGKKYKKELKSFIKKNDLDGKSQKDLVKLLAYYDTNIAQSS